jgi:hypothetical protein
MPSSLAASERLPLAFLKASVSNFFSTEAMVP